MSSLCSKATGAPSRTILEPIHWGMWRFFEKRWRASVSVHPAACNYIVSLTFFLYYTLLVFWTGTDESAIIELLGSRTNKQRVPLVAAYKTTYGKVRFAVFHQLRLTQTCSSFLRCFLFPLFDRIWTVTWNLSWQETLRSLRWPCCWLHLTLTQLNSEKP